MFTKLIHFAKMSWMLFWRMTLIGAILMGGSRIDGTMLLWISLGVSAILVFVFNRTLLTWPLARLIFRKRVVIPANSWGSDAAKAPAKPVTRAPHRGRGGPSAPPVHAPAPTITGYVSTASANGRMTGYEPAILEARPVPRGLMMIGEPGAGLHGAKGMSQTNIDLGVRGEQNFARALEAAGQVNRFGTIWSVPVPDQDRFIPGPYGTDIDCILATSSAIFLVDLKNYKSGDVRYYNRGNELYCEDVATGKQVGEVKTMTRNMEMATKAVRKHFPQANIVPVVVFMPTDKGEGVLENVVWPGGVPAMNLSEFLSVLANQQDFAWGQPQAGSFSRLSNLLTMGTRVR